MGIYDFAMEVEKEGEALYRDFAKKSSDQGLKNIFTWLAEQENKHFKIFQNMKEGKSISQEKNSFSEEIKTVFSDWKNHKDQFNYKISQSDLYKKALEIEKKSIDFYTEESKKIDSEEQKKIFLKIAKEEETHYAVMENIIEFINAPARWVENAEFSHIGDEY